MRRVEILVRSAAVAAVMLAIPAKANQANDAATCTNEKSPPDAVLAACGRLISSKKFSGPTLATLRFWRGVASNRKGDYAGVIADMSEAIRLAPSAAAFNLRGSAYYDKGDHEHAIADFNEAIRLEPGGGIIFHNRGNVYLQKRDYKQAAADFDQAIRLGLNDPVAFQNRGQARQALGNLDGGLADMNEAIRLQPRSPFGFMGRGLLRRAKAELDLAIADYTESLRLATSGNAVIPTLTPPGSVLIRSYESRGLAYEAKGDIAHAREDFAAVLGVNAVDEASKALQASAKARLAVLASDDRPTLPVAAPPEGADAAGRRIALVIGNGTYANANVLPNPPNDARAVATTLREMGFVVSEGLNLERADMRRLVSEFLRNAVTARVALVFYAGHGMQIDGKNYLAPIDAEIDDADHLVTSMTDVDAIMAALDDPIRASVLILDACRDNPLAPTEAKPVAGRSIKVARGLAAPASLGPGATAGAGTLIAFATGPGQVALDGEGAHSPFTAALLRHLSTPGVEVQQMLTRVRAEVVAATQRKQVPWSNSSLLGEVYLVGSP